MAMNQYPFNFDGLARGDFLSRDAIEERMPEVKGKNHDEFKLFLLGLRDKIALHFEHKGDLAYIKCEVDGLRILTHLEQSIYTAQMQDRLRNRTINYFKFQSSTDIAEFTQAEKNEHERQLLINSHYIQAMARTTRILKGTPVGKLEEKT